MGEIVSLIESKLNDYSRMDTYILYLLIIYTLFSCDSNSFEISHNQVAISQPVRANNLPQNIRFEISAQRINTFRETIEVTATLFNDNNDTVYFLTSTCDGEQYLLQYDTSKYELNPFLNCNASFPRIQAIDPKNKYVFQAHFRYNPEETKMKMGFDFYAVEKSFDIRDKTLANLNLFNRSVTEQAVLWAKAIEIERDKPLFTDKTNH